ncbi:hypothetical protein EH165_02450 [Nakamurella antarctica]|uniref:Uncharacterized protein n=1 Tax=Nakamurella antarctica TaxID=1902245 RepID=A0A3G8ZK12_9ACTN|nr:hypothetical protein [Nakamurella antarctica]AZI57185.1 hypothetical protein EH165_02450 [Nakamurella antarctica]
MTDDQPVVGVTRAGDRLNVEDALTQRSRNAWAARHFTLQGSALGVDGYRRVGSKNEIMTALRKA